MTLPTRLFMTAAVGMTAAVLAIFYVDANVTRQPLAQRLTLGLQVVLALSLVVSVVSALGAIWS